MKEPKKSTKEKLRESEEKLKDFMKAATEGFLVYDSELILREINDSALRIIGKRGEDVIGKHILEITPGLENTGRYNEYLNVIKTGEPFYTDDAAQTSKFRNIHLSINAFKLMGGLGMIFNDVTERRRAEKKLKEEKEKAQTYLDTVGVILLVLNADQTVQLINRKGCEILKENEDEIIGVNWIDKYIPENNRELVKREYNRFVNGEIKLFKYTEEPLIKKNGEKRIIAWHNRALKNAEGKIVGSLSSGQDITERMEVEQKLKKSEKKYREAYNRAEFYKDLFTHDINNILQNILSGIELSEMEIGVSEKLEKLKENINIIKGQLTRGSKLVSNIRKLSKLEEEEISIKKVEICSILKKSIAYVKNAYQDRDITIQVELIDKELYIKANELLEDLFENILINAIKYHEGPKVEIHIKISREKKEEINSLKVEFIDNGIGIEDSRKELVFQRGNSDEQRVHGMGLGLSLVQKIIDNYEGKIWVEDRVHGDYTKGSNFVILIPEVL